MNLLDSITNSYIRKNIPQFGVGDTIEVGIKFIEGEKEKLHEFKGVVIARRGKGASETIVIRKMSYGEGIERTFYLHSPAVKSIEVIKKGKVRRAKLYYLRGKIGKKAKVKELELVPKTTEEAIPDASGTEETKANG